MIHLNKTKERDALKPACKAFTNILLGAEDLLEGPQ